MAYTGICAKLKIVNKTIFEEYNIQVEIKM